MAMDDLPVLKKCCFCMPLRYGLLTWGYMKLGAAVTVLTFFTLIVLVLSEYIRRDNLLITIIVLIEAVLVIEIILHIVFIIGAHKKSVKLLQAYYHYAVFMWVVTMIMCFGCTGFLVVSIISRYDSDSGFLITLNVVGFFCSIAVQSFLLISLRSEIIKLRSNCPYRFVKNENDPEGTIVDCPVKEEEEIQDNGKGTTRIL
ncbi:hypothetical protein PYW08_011576 [Mythimna loreyi]|uniref:Uncharacterized protein n=1 Tax=Mythimna loreyi TaxID=667449 RepID=A0ACC2QJX7_9NEOP|nr:hypothetical protein PYW08_011576 [Mythimna loreyi]